MSGGNKILVSIDASKCQFNCCCKIADRCAVLICFYLNTGRSAYSSVPQLERSSRGGGGGANLFLGVPKFLGWISFPKFSVDLLKKKGHRADLVYFSPSFRLVSKNKKSHHLETAAREREVWVGMLRSLGGRHPLLPP